MDTWFAQYGGDAIPGDVTTTNNNGDVTDMEPEAALVEAGFLAAESTDYIVSNNRRFDACRGRRRRKLRRLIQAAGRHAGRTEGHRDP